MCLETRHVSRDSITANKNNQEMKHTNNTTQKGALDNSTTDKLNVG